MTGLACREFHGLEALEQYTALKTIWGYRLSNLPAVGARG